MPLPTDLDFKHAIASLLYPDKVWPLWAVKEKLIDYFQVTGEELEILMPSAGKPKFDVRLNAARSALKSYGVIHCEGTKPESTLCLTPKGKTWTVGWNDHLELRNEHVPSKTVDRGAIKQAISDNLMSAMSYYAFNSLIPLLLGKIGEHEAQRDFNPQHFNFSIGAFCRAGIACTPDDAIFISFYMPFTIKYKGNPPSVVRKFVEECRMLGYKKHMLVTPTKLTRAERDYLAASGLNIHAFDIEDISEILIETPSAIEIDTFKGTFKLKEHFFEALR